MNNYKRHTIHHILNDENYYEWDWDDYEDENFDGCNVDYDYIGNENDTNDTMVTYHQKVGWRRKSMRVTNGPLRIDMMSIYSKEMLRQVKIDQILSKSEDSSNTIGNIVKAKYPLK